MKAAGIAVALVLAGSVPVAAADAIATYGEFYVRAAMSEKCHGAADQVAVSKTEALRRAALEEFWSEIDAVNPTHHEENRLRAEELLQQERERRDKEIDARIRDDGCQSAEVDRLPARSVP